MDRKKQVLIILMAVWALLIVYRFGTQEEPKRVPLKYVKGQFVSKNELPLRSQPGFTVRLDLLEDRSKIALNNPRNVFAPLRIYLPPPPLPPPPPQLPPPPPPPTPEELAIQQARRDLSQFRYLGYLNKGQGRDQAFLARDRELFIVGKGQTISGSIYLKDLTSSYVILQEKNTHVEVTLNISGTDLPPQTAGHPKPDNISPPLVGKDKGKKDEELIIAPSYPPTARRRTD